MNFRDALKHSLAKFDKALHRLAKSEANEIRLSNSDRDDFLARMESDEPNEKLKAMFEKNKEQCMGYWNYRVVRRSTGNDGKPLDTPFFAIHEAYYDEEGKPNSITLDPVEPVGDTMEELRATLVEQMSKALNGPVLEWEDFAGKDEERSRDTK